jgi:hypothetical protein
MKSFKAGFVYFVLVFATGFVFGTIRTLWAVPRFGVRISELGEEPLMLVVVIISSQWVVRRLDVPRNLDIRTGMGASALVLLLSAEFAMIQLRGLSLGQSIASRDPVSGVVYLLMLAVGGEFIKSRGNRRLGTTRGPASARTRSKAYRGRRSAGNLAG